MKTVTKSGFLSLKRVENIDSRNGRADRNDINTLRVKRDSSMKTWLLFFSLLVLGSLLGSLLGSGVSAQVIQSGDITAHVDSIISNMPDVTPSGAYLQPGSSSRAVWRSIIQAILAQDFAAADSIGATLSYQVVQFTDTEVSPNKVYYILERTPTSTSRYWGTFVFNFDASRPTLAIQCPHPRYDLKTGNQGFYCFKKSGAFAYFVAGTHRCNGETATMCDGTTTACGSPATAYRYSDQAHVVLGTFQLTTEEMLMEIPGLIIIQPHGYSAGTGDPDLIMSNGTRITPSATDWLVMLRDNLLLQDASLTFKLAHIDLDWTELLARNNCQGRLLNGSSDPCGTNAFSSTGRFLHLEQRYSGLRDNQANWNKLANAIIATFPAESQFSTTQSGSWTDPDTWNGGIVPGPEDDVYISSGTTVSVDDTLAECHAVMFGGLDALIDMNARSRLTVYGDFTLFSQGHNVFSAGWSSDSAFVRLAGGDTQTLSGWSTNGGSTSFRDLIIDKDSGSVATTSGTGMRLCVQNSLEIISGRLELAPDDDFEGRWTSSGNFLNNELPTVTVHEDGEFTMIDGSGTHFIRSGSSSNPIGLWTIYGNVTFTDASSYDISLGNVNVKVGGQLMLSTGLGSSTYGPEFNPGTITVDSGGVVFCETTSDLWFETAVVVLNRGGVYKTSSSTTILPPAFTNDGKVRYQRNPSTATTDQEVVDRDYWDIEFSFNGNGTRKLWDLTDNHAIADSLEVNNSAEVIITAGSSRSLTVGNSLRLTSGSLDISDADVSLALADGVTISRATGTISNAPDFAGVVDVRYTSSVTSVETGPELPTGVSTLRDMTILASDQTVTLGADATVNGELTLSAGTFDNNGASDDQTLSLADGVAIRRATGDLTAAPSFGNSVNVEYISTVGAVTTGPELPTSTSVLNDLTISGNKGVTLGSDVTVNGVLHMADSILLTDTYTVTLASAATIVEDSGRAVQGRVGTTRTVAQNTAETFGGLGLQITALDAAPGSTNVLRVTGESDSVGGADGVLRRFEVSPTVNTGLNATVVFGYNDNELNGQDENGLVIYRSTNAGGSWENLGGSVNTAANTVTVTGLDNMSWLTLGGPSLGCCVGVRGNIDNDPDDNISLGDLTALIDILFISLNAPLCWEEANLDGSPDGPGSVSLGDLTALIDVLFISLEAPAPCP